MTYQTVCLRTLTVLLIGLTFPILYGCGGATATHVPVKGKVMIGKKPLTTGLVIFQPDKSKGNEFPHAARGQIDEQGNYQLDSDAGKPGTPAGHYLVAIVATRKKDPKDEYSEMVSLIPTGYNDPKTSGMKVEVKADAKDGAYDLLITN